MASIPVAEVMTRQVVYLPASATLDEAAQVMRDRSIGDVVVTRGATMVGLVTDRDIVVRAVAENRPANRTTLGDIVARELLMIEQSSGTDEALHAMRGRGVRRLLVCDADRKPVGIVSLSDLALLPAGTP